VRKWRVGTVSMGLSLILLGFFLFLALINGHDAFQTFFAWWPLILIVLGLEITVYSFLPNKENSFLKYDFLSIFFVGIIGTIGIGMTVLTSTGIIDEVKELIAAEHVSINIEKADYQVDSNIKRIVLNTNNEDVNIEGTEGKIVSLFGTYEATIIPNEQTKSVNNDDYVLIEQVGDTMYVYIKAPSENRGPFGSFANLDLTIILPNSIALEVNGEHSSISMNPGKLISNWVVKNARDINVNVNKMTDIQVSIQASRIEGNIIDEEKYKNHSDYENKYEEKYIVGNGSYHLQLLDAQNVQVDVIE
jgi:hypothetical protein